MAAATLQSLGKVTNTSVEKSAYGPDDWTATQTAANGAIACGPAALANNQHFLRQVSVSASADLSAAKVMEIKDGTTVIWHEDLAVNFRRLALDFNPPLQSTIGAALTVTVEASGAASVSVNAKGFTTPGNLAVTV